jgi:microcystin-dependent protein
MAIVLNGTTGITTPAIDAGNDVGQVATFAMSTAPSGWLKANGATVSRTTYAALFTAIGTTFGAGDGSTTFLLPDLRGEFARGWDDGRGIDSGRAFGSAQADEFKSHTHTATRPLSTAAAGSGAFGSTVDTAGTTGSTGGSETRPRNIALLACIKF